jgi:hypothetical protein
VRKRSDNGVLADSDIAVEVLDKRTPRIETVGFGRRRRGEFGRGRGLRRVREGVLMGLERVGDGHRSAEVELLEGWLEGGRRRSSERMAMIG